MLKVFLYSALGVLLFIALLSANKRKHEAVAPTVEISRTNNQVNVRYIGNRRARQYALSFDIAQAK